MPAKNNPKPLTKSVFHNVKLADVKDYLRRINRELRLNLNIPDGATKSDYIDMLLPILNEHEYYFYEDKPITSYWISHFIDRVKPTVLMQQFREEQQLPSQPGPNWVNNFIEEEEEEPDLNDNDNNLNSNNQNNILSFEQMQRQPIIQREREQLLRSVIDRFNQVSINPITQQDLSNDFQSDLDMVLQRLAQLQTRQPSNGRASSKKGMNQIYDIVLDLQRDIKRVSKAISPQGAQAMVNDHNAKYPEGSASRWSLVHRDVNNDGIPDVIIKNTKNEPIYINGYTTTKSDYPIRYEFYNSFPTRDARKQAMEHYKSLSNFAKDKFGVAYNDDFNGDLHALGNMTTWTKPESWANYQLDNYKGFPKKQRNLSAFDRFKRYVLGDKIEDVLGRLASAHNCYIPGKYKIRVISKATALLWKSWILSKVSEEHFNIPVEGEAMEKYKKSSTGKSHINNVVSNLLNHLNLTNEEVGWNEENRSNLENQLYDEIAQAIYHFAEEIVPADELHGRIDGHQMNEPLPEHYPQEEQYRAHQDRAHQWTNETYHDFGTNEYTHQPYHFEPVIDE